MLARRKTATSTPAPRGMRNTQSTAAIQRRNPATSRRSSNVNALEPALTEAMSRS